MSEDKQEIDLKNIVVQSSGNLNTGKIEGKIEEKKEESNSDFENIESISKIELSLEDQARLQGWKPKEEYSGDPNTWVEAKYFIERGVLYHKQSKLAKENRELKEQQRQLAENQAKLYEMAYNQALSDIEAAKREVALNKDFDGYEKVLRAEQDLKNSYKPIQVPKSDTELSSEAEQHVKRVKESIPWKRFSLLNPWAEKDDPDSKFLKDKAAHYSTRFPEATSDDEYDKQLTEIHKYVRRDYRELVDKLSPRPKVMPVTSYSGRADSQGVTFEQKISNYPAAIQAGANYLKRAGQEAFIDEYLSKYKK